MKRLQEQKREQDAEQRIEHRLRYLFAIVHQSMRAKQVNDNPMLGEITEDEWEQYCQVELFDLMEPGFKQSMETMARITTKENGDVEEVKQDEQEAEHRRVMRKATEARVRLRYVKNVTKRIEAAVEQLGEPHKLWRTMHDCLRYLIWFREEDEEAHAHTRQTWLADQAERKKMQESGGGVEDKEHSFRWVVSVPSEADLRRFETVMADRVRRSAFLAQYTPMRVEPQSTSVVLALQSLLESKARVAKEIRRVKSSVFACDVHPMTDGFVKERMRAFCMLSIPVGAYPTAALATLRSEINKVLLSLCTTSIVEAVQKAYRAKAVEYLSTVEDLKMDKMKRAEMIERGAMAFANALNEGKI